jgi:hypothetical protein
VVTASGNRDALRAALNLVEQNGQTIFAVLPWSRYYEVRSYPQSEQCWDILCCGDQEKSEHPKAKSVLDTTS